MTILKCQLGKTQKYLENNLFRIHDHGWIGLRSENDQTHTYQLNPIPSWTESKRENTKHTHKVHTEREAGRKAYGKMGRGEKREEISSDLFNLNLKTYEQ